MSCDVKADVLIHTAFPYHLLQRLADGPIVQVGEYEVVFLERSVTLYYLQRDVQQLHLERYARLVPLGDNPLLAVHFHNAIVGQFLDVHERKGGETRKHEQVTDIRQLRVCELVRHHRFQLVFRQELTLLDIRTDVELRKRVPRYQTVEVCPHHHAFQPHALFPYRAVAQSRFRGEIDRELLDEIGRKLQHRHVVALVERLNERRYIVPRHHSRLIDRQFLSLPTRFLNTSFSRSKALSSASYSPPMP